MSVCPHPNLGAWFGNQIWNPPFLLKRDVKRCSKNTDFFWLYRGFPSLIFFENIPFETGFQTRHTKNAQNVQKWAHKQPLAVLEWMKRNRRGHKSSHVEDEMGFLFSPFWQIINLDEGWCDSRNRQIRGKNNFKHWLFQGFLESIFWCIVSIIQRGEKLNIKKTTVTPHFPPVWADWQFGRNVPRKPELIFLELACFLSTLVFCGFNFELFKIF